MKFNPITRVQPRKLRLWPVPVNHGYRPRMESCVLTPLWNLPVGARNAENYVPQITYWFASFTLSGRHHRLPPHPWSMWTQGG